jgi:aminoglycoside phosphotransferase (APT) family kinase protein
MIPGEILALVPGCAGRETPLAVVPLGAGTSHDAWRVRTRCGQFVLRLPRAGSATLGASLQREMLLQSVAADAGFAPRIVATHERTRASVVEFVAARAWQRHDFGDAAQLTGLWRRIGEMQRLPTPQCEAFDPVATLAGYWRALERGARVRGRSQAETLDEAARLWRAIGAGERAATILHCDLQHGNVLDSRPLQFIDWQFAQVGDPLLEFAALMSYRPELRTAAPRALQLAGRDHDSSIEQLAAATELFDLLVATWAAAQPSASAS